MAAQPFTISVPQEEIDDLHHRLDRTRWPGFELDDWTEGVRSGWLRQLVEDWRSSFDWRRAEHELNQHTNLMVPTGELAVHCIHREGVGPAPMPLLLSHGWPSSIVEWRRVIDRLADPASYGDDPADAFHVVAPSLPGYGFSEIPAGPGTDPRAIASCFARLMSELGYERFGAHGCDWGSYVTSLLGLDHPERLTGIHMGMLSLSSRDRRSSDPALDAEYRERVKRWRANEQGYVAIQSSKPQSLAAGLSDSPAGLAAWIAEKWRAWTDCGGELFDVIERDELLTNISIYWFTNTIASANRLYRESKLRPVVLDEGRRVEVPAGFILEAPGREGDSRSFQDTPRIGAPPRHRAEAVFDVRRWTVLERGGHFPALEVPDRFVDEVRAFFRPLR